MISIPLVCPECGSWDIEPRRISIIKCFKQRLLGKKHYHCNECNWRGYIGEEGKLPPLDWIILTVNIANIAVLAILIIYG
jgi:predicted RNA-binding Zn-ribbon protein involved in translation (DUF1610 family)